MVRINQDKPQSTVKGSQLGTHRSVAGYCLNQRPCNEDEQNGGDQLILLDVGHFPLCGGFVVFKSESSI